MENKKMVYDAIIIGNGFDLNYGQPTTYGYFYEMIKKASTSQGFDDFIASADKLLENNKIHLKCDVNNLDMMQKLHSFYDEARKDNFFVSYFLKYNKLLDTWTSFESELLNILTALDCLIMYKDCLDVVIPDNMGFGELCIGEGLSSKQFHLINRFCEIIPQNNYFKFYDIIKHENIKKLEIKMKIPESKCSASESLNYLNYTTAIKDILDGMPFELLAELKAFERIFELYLEAFTRVPDNIKPLDFEAKNIINYNYTNIADKLLVHKELTTREVVGKNGFTTEEYEEVLAPIHIHGRICDNKPLSNIIFGVDAENGLSDSLQIFNKEMRMLTSESEFNNIALRLNGINTLAIYGHSLDKADNYTLKYILEKVLSYPTSEIYLYYRNPIKSPNDKPSLVNNLSLILGRDKLMNLLSYGRIKFIQIDEDIFGDN